ncbi:hypothetical protein OG500_26350 [Kitasatospora sp. NBC_01250]|uniref:hypothetical protein n=1 Tax=unclassified Kitasatospora TaxID=2633591 RepID=UPI002E114395|nr:MULTISPECIES: hypothetical protein [unclassified Kitasatospora]WSJ69654.1 hypothetical protein OG294_28135 [Kitasatospora sp. NBC_01302]
MGIGSEWTAARRQARLLGAAGLVLLPWIAVLLLALRDSAGWAALDLAEAGCLLGTAVLLSAGHRLHRPLAGCAALLLVSDALWDLGTANTASGLLVALAMAVLAELPLAALCAALALRGPGRMPRRRVAGAAVLALAA